MRSQWAIKSDIATAGANINAAACTAGTTITIQMMPLAARPATFIQFCAAGAFAAPLANSISTFAAAVADSIGIAAYPAW